MDTQNFRNLQEAYLEVYEDRISDLQDKIRQKKASGATRRQLSDLRNELQGRQRIKKGHRTWVKGGQPPHLEVYEDRISDLQDKIRQKKASGATRRQLSDLRNELQGRQRIKKGHRTWVKGGQPPQSQQEQVDLYDLILTHLLDEGYAETPEAAEVIMVNMSEEWRNDIMEMNRFEKKRYEK
jgi:IS5 family transposase